MLWASGRSVLERGAFGLVLGGFVFVSWRCCHLSASWVRSTGLKMGETGAKQKGRAILWWIGSAQRRTGLSFYSNGPPFAGQTYSETGPPTCSEWNFFPWLADETKRLWICLPALWLRCHNDRGFSRHTWAILAFLLFLHQACLYFALKLKIRTFHVRFKVPFPWPHLCRQWWRKPFAWFIKALPWQGRERTHAGDGQNVKLLLK